MQKRIMRPAILILVFAVSGFTALSQDAAAVIRQVKEKLEKVKDYQAKAVLKTDVSFMRVPQSDVNVYFKRPDKFRITKEGGISILPKGGSSINLNALLSGDKFAAVSGGETTLAGLPVKIIKLLPLEESGEVVLTTLYVDNNFLIRKATTTTRDNGTYQMEMEYGKFATWALPDRVIFTFNAREYSLPKGVTLEYEGAAKPPADAQKTAKQQKGRIEVTYTSYSINKGISDNLFR